MIPFHRVSEGPVSILDLAMPESFVRLSSRPKSAASMWKKATASIKAESEIESPRFAVRFDACKASVEEALDSAFAKLIDVRAYSIIIRTPIVSPPIFRDHLPPRQR